MSYVIIILLRFSKSPQVNIGNLQFQLWFFLDFQTYQHKIIPDTLLKVFKSYFKFPGSLLVPFSRIH